MKLIALDVGTKRIGIAKADTKVRIAIPYAAVEVNDGSEFQKIASLIRAWGIQGVVIGLPRSNEGNETKQSEYVRRFAARLKREIAGIKICFQDESLTSVEAEKRLKGRKKSYKKGDIDSEAAVIILQDFLEEKVGKPSSKAASVRRKSVKGNKPRRWIGVIIGLIVLLLLASGGAAYYYFDNLKPKDTECGSKCQEFSFVVETGRSLSEVANQLQLNGYIRNAYVFQIYFRLTSGESGVKAGEYSVGPGMSVQEIAKLLSEGGDKVFTYTLLPGEQVSRVRKDLIDLGYSKEEVNNALENHYRDESFGWVFEGMPEEQLSLEGYLYGNTYEFFAEDSAEAVVKRLIQEFATVIENNNFKEKFAEHGLNLYEGITLASVVQREANGSVDMARVAQVFYNRLSRGMSLGSDVTAIYAADLVDPNREIYTNNAAVLNIESAYNTRKYTGLPYGPVSNPGILALNAVAEPDSEMANMLFFLTGDDNIMYYSDTEAGHNQNIIQHCQVLCNVGL